MRFKAKALFRDISRKATPCCRFTASGRSHGRLVTGFFVQGATSVSMSMDRRSAAAAIGAGIISIPLASEAKGGDFPKVKMA